MIGTREREGHLLGVSLDIGSWPCSLENDFSVLNRVVDLADSQLNTNSDSVLVLL